MGSHSPPAIMFQLALRDFCATVSHSSHRPMGQRTLPVFSRAATIAPPQHFALKRSGMEAARQTQPIGRFEQLRLGREVLRAEGHALLALAEGLADEFCLATELLHQCRGSVVVTGMGKAGLV